MLVLNMVVVALCVAAIVMASLYWAASGRLDL
jgi:nitrogen fixation-related uncharacterized protein